MALICIAHPKFRAQLLREAIEAKFLSAELADKEGRLIVGPKETRTTHLLTDGTQIVYRPIHPTDEPRMRDLFYQLSEQSKYYRFMNHLARVPRSQIEDFVYVDHRNEVCIVSVLPEAAGDTIIAVGNYFLDPKTNKAEVAFAVSDRWQRKGIGTFMLELLSRIARRNGIAGFTAEVLAENKGMQTVFNRSGLKTKSEHRGDVFSYEMDFD
jgi:RimJ/RimL family protein N-acetyltransferase